MKLTRRTALEACALGLGLLLSQSSPAVIGATDNVPAATLLLPYFEVSTTENIESRLPQTVFEAYNTVAQIRNASAQPQLARVTVWTDYGIPTLSFDVYLNGNDSQDLDLRLLFAGVLPVTGTGISRPNNVSGVNPPAFPGCAAKLNTTRLDATQLLALRNAHRGLPSTQFGGQCGGRDYGDELARGYVTVDVVNQCTAATTNPTSANYFAAGGSGIAGNQNVLFGDYTVTDAVSNHAYGDRLVSVEADAANPLTSQNNRYTFYAGFVGYSARDNREPLGAVWHADFAATTGASGSDLVVWRDPRGVVSPSCASVPAPWERPAKELVFFDEQSGAGQLDPARTTLGLAAQRLPVNTNPAIPSSGPYRNYYTPFAFGLHRLNLNDSSEQPGAPPGWTVRQSWVVTTHQSNGRFQSGNSGRVLGSATETLQQLLAGNGLPVYPQIPTTTTILGINPSSSVTGQSVTVNYSVAPAAVTVGNVRVTTAGNNGACQATVAAGSCSFVMTAPAGPVSVVANYQGRAAFAPSTSTAFTHTSNKADTTLTISAHTPDPSVVNTAVNVTVILAAVAPGTGNVSLLAGTLTVTDGVDSCTIVTPAVSCVLTLSTVGSRTLTASWPGNTRYNGSTSPGVSHTVAASRVSTSKIGGAP